jgi:isoquinoline 1-oxidoreductase beta subunit
MSGNISLNRRGFVVSTAAALGGFSLGWKLPGIMDAQAQATIGSDVGIWVQIYPDDTTIVRIARAEMGQGTLTGLAQLVADELDANWSKVKAEYVKPEENLAKKRQWGDMSTGGSRGIRSSVEYVRQGGAAARAMLIQAAANQWKVPASECTAANSVVTHKSGKKLRYGQVAEAAAKLEVPQKVPVKDPKDWKIVGKGVKRLDTVDKLNGKQVYAIDVKLPGMLNAAIAQCPVFGGKLKSFDADKIKGEKGVRHVVKVDDNTVAVVADTWWQAKTALEKLPIEWDEGENAKVSSETIAEFVKGGLTDTDAKLGQKHGDVEAGLAKAAKKVEAVYGSPFLNHATMEPMNCTAKMDGDKVEIWVASQNGEASLTAAAKAAGVPLTNVKVNRLHLGGGFGRRGAFQDYVHQAVSIAKQVPGKPVKMIWSREEDMQHGFYRPITQARMVGGLDEKGNLVALHARLAGQSILAQVLPDRLVNGVDKLHFQGWLEDEFGYMAIPNLLIDHGMRNTHVPVGFWRGVNHNQNAVYMECFIDELAHAAGKDPLEFRRAIMGKNPKHLAVLNAVAEKAGWGKPLPKGVHRGICQNYGFGSYCAAVAEVSVSPNGKVKIHRVVAAVDPGYAVNPDQIAAQTEGSFVYGLSATLYSENTIKDGRVVEGNFDSYEVMRLEDMPKVETHIVASGGFWGGIGEPTIAVASPAVLNAIFAATGKRVRTLPLKHTDLKSA